MHPLIPPPFSIEGREVDEYEATVLALVRDAPRIFRLPKARVEITLWWKTDHGRVVVDSVELSGTRPDTEVVFIYHGEDDGPRIAQACRIYPAAEPALGSLPAPIEAAGNAFWTWTHGAGEDFDPAESVPPVTWQDSPLCMPPVGISGVAVRQYEEWVRDAVVERFRDAVHLAERIMTRGAYPPTLGRVPTIPDAIELRGSRPATEVVIRHQGGSGQRSEQANIYEREIQLAHGGDPRGYSLSRPDLVAAEIHTRWRLGRLEADRGEAPPDPPSSSPPIPKPLRELGESIFQLTTHPDLLSEPRFDDPAAFIRSDLTEAQAEEYELKILEHLRTWLLGDTREGLVLLDSIDLVGNRPDTLVVLRYHHNPRDVGKLPGLDAGRRAEAARLWDMAESDGDQVLGGPDEVARSIANGFDAAELPLVDSDTLEPIGDAPKVYPRRYRLPPDGGEEGPEPDEQGGEV